MRNFLFFLSSLFIFSLLQSGTRAVDYQVNDKVPWTAGGSVFESKIGTNYAHQTLESATNFIWSLFKANRDDIQHVWLSIEPSKEPAQTANNIIHLSSDYLAGLNGWDVKKEFKGTIYHEMTHVWQWNGNGKASPALTNGIADFVRLKAGLWPANWAKPGQGENWDESSAVTARFLEYCEGLKSGFVGQLNAKMRNDYDDRFFWDLLGKPMGQLWAEYKAKYGKWSK